MSNVERQGFNLITCLVNVMLLVGGGGIEPRPAACQADVLTTWCSVVAGIRVRLGLGYVDVVDIRATCNISHNPSSFIVD